MNPHLSLCVIGHVNHGKTALVRALTGIECDRLPEETARGMSMTLGFAYRTVGDADVDFLDAPGHEDFIRAMVSGATGTQSTLLVVAASEGVRRQTLEHARIASLLGITPAALVISKADLFHISDRKAREEAIRSELADVGLSALPAFWVSALTGEGLEALLSHLASVIASTPPLSDDGGFYLPIDRVFTVHGAGLVVTGTLLGGPLTEAETPVVMPSGVDVGIRDIQIHARPVSIAGPGARTAVNLRGVRNLRIRPGDVLCRPGVMAASDCIDIKLSEWRHPERPLKHMDRIRVMSGTRSDVATVHLLDQDERSQAPSMFARLRFREQIAVRRGMKVVLRDLSPPRTLCGGLVVDPSPEQMRGRRRDRSLLLEAAVSGDAGQVADLLAHRDRGRIDITETARLTGLSEREVEAAIASKFLRLTGSTLASRDALASVQQHILVELKRCHDAAPRKAVVEAGRIRGAIRTIHHQDLVTFAVEHLCQSGEIRTRGGDMALVRHDPLKALSEAERRRLDDIETELRQSGITPPDVDRIAQTNAEMAEFIDILIGLNRATSLYNHALRRRVVLHRQCIARAHEDLMSRYPPPVAFTTGEARETLGANRRIIVPLLEHFDQLGLTVRSGDTRTLNASSPCKDLWIMS